MLILWAPPRTLISGLLLKLLQLPFLPVDSLDVTMKRNIVGPGSLWLFLAPTIPHPLAQQPTGFATPLNPPLNPLEAVRRHTSRILASCRCTVHCRVS